MRRLIRQPVPISATTGSISAACTRKRAPVIWPTGIVAEASFAQTSSSGARTQKAIISATPGRMRSEEAVMDPA